MICRDLMKSLVHCINVNDTVQAAAKRMRDTKVGFLPVCDDAGKVLGAVTDRDITVRATAAGLEPTTRISSVMSLEPVSCLPTDDIRVAQQLMAEHRKSRILCCDENGSLVGVISLSDIAARADSASASKTLQQVSSREARA